MSDFNDARPMGWLAKSIYFLVIGCLLVLGVVGLVLPIIPGLVFLFLGLLLASRVSSRVNNVMANHRGFRSMRRR